MEENAKAMVMASFVADALSLGAHWMYDPQKIQEKFGRVDRLIEPQPQSFHKNKGKGAFTHYGDQMMVLLASVAEKGAFDPADFSERWRQLFDHYDGYFDMATKKTLANYKEGKPPEEAGSQSDDLAGASRIAPVVCRYRDDPDRLAEAAETQARMTHGDPATVESAAYFARVAQAVLAGKAPTEAMKSVAEAHFDVSPVSAWLQKGLATVDRDSVEVIGEFGRSCHTGEMFPGVVHLIAKYEKDLKEALIQCVMTAGDSAARGALVGMVLGAHHGIGDLPEEWFEEMNATETIRKHLEKMA
jgi:ADP-ribosylglycohydrolase